MLPPRTIQRFLAGGYGHQSVEGQATLELLRKASSSLQLEYMELVSFDRKIIMNTSYRNNRTGQGWQTGDIVHDMIDELEAYRYANGTGPMMVGQTAVGLYTGSRQAGGWRRKPVRQSATSCSFMQRKNCLDCCHLSDNESSYALFFLFHRWRRTVYSPTPAGQLRTHQPIGRSCLSLNLCTLLDHVYDTRGEVV